MKKWIAPLLSLLLVAVLLYLSGPSATRETLASHPQKPQTLQLQTQGDDTKEQSDPHLIQILIQVQEKLDAWLKAINERIESQDVSRIEVRFLEILRNIVEWVKEKVDAKIDSSRGKTYRRKGLQET